MQVRILGPLEVASNGELVPLGGPKQRLVLTALAVRLGQVVSTDELVEAGWGDDLPANPTNTLQYQVAQLRKVIEPDPSDPRYLITAKPGYLLDADMVTTDAALFAKMVTTARDAFADGDTDRAQASIDDALGLWRGPALAEFDDLDFARSEAGRLEADRVEAIELQIDIALAQGRHAEVTARLGQL
ncbi:MAG: AfsR/SARP family transcriptional regulator, partial [Acidimicrobiales bacterium]